MEIQKKFKTFGEFMDTFELTLPHPELGVEYCQGEHSTFNEMLEYIENLKGDWQRECDTYLATQSADSQMATVTKEKVKEVHDVLNSHQSWLVQLIQKTDYAILEAYTIERCTNGTN